MRHSEEFTYRKRSFLNPVSTGLPSYVLAEVESSKDGEYKCGHYMLTLADCKRIIELEFPLVTARDRKVSLAKIDLLIKTFEAFGLALRQEAELIAKCTKSIRARRTFGP